MMLIRQYLFTEGIVAFGNQLLHVRSIWWVSITNPNSTADKRLKTLFVSRRGISQANSASYPQLDGKWVPAKVRWCSAAGE